MQKKYTYWAVGIVAVAILIWAVYAQMQKNNAGNKASEQDSLSRVPTTTPLDANGTKKLSYGDAIKAYPNRFQFSKCLGTPAVIAVKKGTPVMLDNRDAVAHSFKADTQTFRISGYDYTILYPQVIGNLPVSCDGKNRVTLNVQK